MPLEHREGFKCNSRRRARWRQEQWAVRTRERKIAREKEIHMQFQGSRMIQRLVLILLLSLAGAPAALPQTAWVSTATKAFPVQYLSNASLIGPLDSSTPMHIVVGLQEQNAQQVQPTLRRMITAGDPLYGTSLTVQQFVAQFGPTPAQVQAVESYLAANGFTNIAVADNQLLVEADG